MPRAAPSAATGGPELKFAGYDSLIVQGRTKKPVYILIRDDRVEIKDASHLWGKDTYETQKIMRQELGDERTKTLAIGLRQCRCSGAKRKGALTGPL
nr:aldehyde ferredoxin oxidoreductase N-terminal domain-containing protein [Gelria sp. Kuro-4]